MPFEKPLEPSGPLPGHLIADPSAERCADKPLAPFEPPEGMSARLACRIVRQMVVELLVLLGDRVTLRRDRRRHACHVRQIAMYVCHVALRMSLSDIGGAFGRDRTTVAHACHVVEDRRDDVAFDDFVAAVERIAVAVFGPSEVVPHD